MTATLSSDEGMLNAYKEGKDLYAIIAQSAFDNAYEDNLEWYVPGKIVKVNDIEMISGAGKEFAVQTDENDSITIKYYEMLETANGELMAKDINIGDIILSDIGNLRVVNKTQINDNISFKFSQ